MAHRWHGPPRKRRVGASEGEAQDSQETTDATSKCPVGRVACVIDCLWRGLGKADARNQGTSNPAPARIPLFPATLLDKMRRATGGSLVGMEPLLSLQTSIGEAFVINWATCQQLADEGSQRDPTQIETRSTGHPNVLAVWSW